MAIDTAVDPAQAPTPATARPRLRLVRATLVAVTVAALLVLVPTLAAWLWGPARSTDVWAGRFGDANITLATDLPPDPGTVTTFAYENTAFGLPDDTSIWAEAFGGPVVEVEKGTWATATGTLTSWNPDLGVGDAPASNGIEFRAPDLEAHPGASTFPTRSAQEAEVRRIADALGLPSDARITKPTKQARYTVGLPPVPGAAQLDFWTASGGPVGISFADDGTLRSAFFTTTLLVDDPPVDLPAVSPAQALDDLRHHRANAYRPPSWTPNLVDRLSGVHFFPPYQDLPPQPGPITSVALLEDGWGAINGHSNPVWEFRDAEGALVGTVFAVQGAVYDPEILESMGP